MPIIIVPKEQEDELMHYGVLGMKWGVRRSIRKSNANERLRVKALKYDKKASTMLAKSEKAHAKNDLDSAYKKAVKAAKYDRKAAILERKSIGEVDGFRQANFHRKSENLKYKAANLRRDANRISKTKGYGLEAMKYSIKSDKAATKAAKARRKIANNEYYIQKMKRKASKIPQSELQKGYQFINKLKNI